MFVLPEKIFSQKSNTSNFFPHNVCILLFLLSKKKSSNILKEKKERTKKSFVFATCLTALKGVLPFLKQSSFWTKIESKDLLILLVSVLLPLFLLQTSIWFCSTKKTKTICFLKPFFLANEETKRKKTSYLFLKPTFCGFFLKEKESVKLLLLLASFPKEVFKRK